MDTDDSDRPAGSPGSGSASASASATPSASGTELGRLPVRRRPIPRKGHTKSRRGCLNCKKRKVKCQETLPECSHCTRIGLVCEYPDGPSRELTISSPSAPLQSTPTLFTGDDMRFFHHFLVNAYPPLPLSGDDIWRDVATMSHSYDYLMHAMLGLAASHLELHGANHSTQALTHRVKAIQSLNKALSTPPASTAEADARFGALFALTFQASCMNDGMTEFLSMIRGCRIIYCTSMKDFPDSVFQPFNREGYSDSVRKLIGACSFTLEADQDVLIQDYLRSLRALAPICTSPLEIRFLAATERVVRMAKISAVDAFAEITTHYSLITQASNIDFAPFLDPAKHASQLLLIHFVLIEFAIGHIDLGIIGSRFAYRKKTCIAWVEQLAADLPDDYKRYADWPVDFVRRLANR